MERKESAEITKDRGAYRIGEPIGQAVDYVIDTVKDRKPSISEKEAPHDVTTSYRIGGVVESAVGQAIDALQERKASSASQRQEEDKSGEPFKHPGPTEPDFTNN